MKFKKAVLLIAFLCILYFLSLTAFTASHTKPPIAKNGILDLTNWSLERDGSISLDGEWEFYWNQLLTYDDFHKGETNYKLSGYFNVPNVWNKYIINGENLPGEGYATYRLRIKTNDTEVLKGLKILNMSTAYKLMINNKVVAKNGIVGKSRETTFPEYRPQAVVFNNETKEFEIIVQVSNYIYSRGGLWYSIYLGTDQQIRIMKENSSRREMFLFGVILIMILYHIAIYWLQKRRNISVLYFCLTLFAIAVRILFTGEYFIITLIPNIDINVMVSIEYITIYWGPPIWLAFIRKLYPEETPKKIMNFFICVALMLTIFTLITPIRIYTKYLIFSEVLAVAIFCYSLFLVFIAFRRKKEGATLLFLGSIILLLTFINDSLYHWNIIDSKPGGMFGFTAFVYIFIQAYVLAARNSKAFDEVEELSNKLISLNKLKDEFLANTSHELRTPLHGIISITETILEGKEGNLNKKQRDNLSLVVSSGKRLANLINDILDYSKLKYHDIKLNMNNVDVQKIVQMVLDAYSYIAETKDITLKNNIPEKEYIIYADEERVSQIFYNLIGNAMEYTQHGTITISGKKNRDMIELSVEDTGIGIPEDKLQDIFKSYEQVEEISLMKKYGGTGLGLNITKKLVSMHGGKIWVTSQLGQGSKFTFSMPISNEHISINNIKTVDRSYKYNNKNQSFTNIPIVLEQDGEFTILVIDDDYINLQSLINVLSSEKYSVIAVTDGIMALDIISKNKEINLVILDVMMPKMSGFEVCEKIREENSLYDLPVIMLTAQTNPKAILTGLEVGANDFLSKPFDVSELRARVKTLLQLEKSVQNAINAEMAFLQAQIKPHFLYNALNTIISLCWTDAERAGKLLIELSNYLRSSFHFNTMNKFVHIKKEIEFVRSYLDIEKARFEEKINYQFKIEENNLDFMIPPFILQPIVENAIKHGILPKEEGGNIIISIKYKSEFIIIIIEDDGVGITEGKLSSIIHDEGTNTRVGIKNINMRMKRIYGYGIIIESEINKGTTISIRIPKKGWEKGA